MKSVNPEAPQLSLAQIGLANSTHSYGHLFNATGLQADRVARAFDVGEHCTLLPFKGFYWQLHPEAPFHFSINLYPVPDLNVPFQGVHVSPSSDGTDSLVRRRFRPGVVRTTGDWRGLNR